MFSVFLTTKFSIVTAKTVKMLWVFHIQNAIHKSSLLYCLKSSLIKFKCPAYVKSENIQKHTTATRDWNFPYWNRRTRMHSRQTRTHCRQTRTHSRQTRSHCRQTRTHCRQTRTHGRQTRTHCRQTRTQSRQTRTHALQADMHARTGRWRHRHTDADSVL